MEIKKTYKYFDLDTLEQKSEDKTVVFEPAKDVAEAQARVGGDESTLLKALNSFLRTEALRQAEDEVTSKGGKRSVVLNVVKPFRALPPFSQIFKLDGEGKPIVENGEKVVDRARQTKAILDMIKSNATMLESIKAGSAEQSEDGDESNDDE